MNFNLEKKLRQRGYRIIIGVDEAGRGPLAGPVTAAAVMVRKSQIPYASWRTKSQKNPKDQNFNDKKWNLIRDSKKLSEKQREELFDFIHKNFYVGVGICDHKTIDRINILQATLLAMKKAVVTLLRNLKRSDLSRPQRPKEVGPLIILVDGNKIIPGLKIEQQAIVGGDRKVKSISAASIIAKVTRDRLMLKMHRKYPNYGFDKHRGYGTKLHLEKLKKFSLTPIHRLSFQPMKGHISLPNPLFDVKLRK
ncbi:ribonuclease HII [Patescibacteria group bacterium]|nr:ribonuclease HII [Patescibacteria group bacterium]